MTVPPTMTGLIGIAVEKGPGRNWILTLSFAPADVPLGTVTPGNIRLTTAEGAPVTDLVVTSVASSSPGQLQAGLDDRRPIPLDLGDGDLPAIILRLVDIAAVDPARNYAGFVLGVAPATPSVVPDAPIGRREPQLAPAVALDYLARDYPAFRQVMLEQLSVLIPGFRDVAADLPVALVETLAYAADQVSYFQDAVATEAYLGTARRRNSVRRHARLVDYRLHEGCNARAWVHVAVSVQLTLPAGTVLAAGTRRFVTMRDRLLVPAHNKLTFLVPPNDPDVRLPQGATRATLGGVSPPPAAGDVLVFEEVINPASGNTADNDPGHRHVVRLTSVKPRPAGGIDIAWDETDALPFPLVLTATIRGDVTGNISLARGNMVLADDGAWQPAVALHEAAPFSGAYQPVLPAGHLTYAAPLDGDASARSALRQDPRGSLPQLALTDGAGFPWTARIDLMQSGPFARNFTVEAEPDGNRLRFGDGVYGRRPPPATGFTVAMRLGNGPGGNVGADTINALAGAPITGIAAIRNPLPAAGGSDPEQVTDARLYAPVAFRSQQRAVTPADYAARAEQFPGIAEAAAELGWTGSWYTISVAVRRPAGAPLDRNLIARLTAYLDRYRCAGVDVAVVAARFVGIVLRLTVHCQVGAAVNAVRSALRETFATGYLPDGRPAFFHPDNFPFGRPVRLSEILDRAMAVPGVAWIVSDPRSDPRVRFGRIDVVAPPLSAPQVIPIGPLEVASAVPAHGGEVAFYTVEP